MAVACSAMLVCSGCLTLVNRANFSELEIHGKVGLVCAAASSIVGVPLDVLCVPGTFVAEYVCEEESGGGSEIIPLECSFVFVLPGVVVELAAYHVGAAIAYPAYLVGFSIPRKLKMRRTADGDPVSHLLNKLPRLSASEYKKLLVASHRKWPPPYCNSWSYSPGTLVGFCATLPEFGHKPNIDSLLAEEWQAWDQQGRPVAGSAEAGFFLQYWVLSRPYVGQGCLELIEDIVGITEEEASQYYKEHAGDPGFKNVWKFWIEEHGGVENVLKERFGDK